MRACGDTARAPALSPPAAGVPHLVALTEDDGRPLGLRGGVTEAPTGPCVRWTVRVRERGDLWVVPASTWLWRPPWLARGAEVTLSVALPAGWALSAPFPELGGDRWSIPPSAWAFEGYLGLGRFERAVVTAEGARFDVACVGPPGCASRLPSEAWLGAAARAVSGVLGRFPVSRVQVLALDGERSEEPVSFGLTSRGGGASVLFTLDSTRPGFERDWVAVHEFSHFLHPATDPGATWLTEGLATYYQEVLRARSGALSEEALWAELLEGFARGREQAGAWGLQAESDAMARTHRYQRVYWTGAAVCFLADVELRRQTRGALSLDALVRALHARATDPTRVWPLRDLTGLFDEASEGRWSAVVGPLVSSPRFPPVDAALASLGVREEGGAVTLDPAAPEAPLRRALLAAPR